MKESHLGTLSRLQHYFFAVMLLCSCLLSASCSRDEAVSNMPDISSANRVELLFKAGFDSTGTMSIKKIIVTGQDEIFRLQRTFSNESFPYIYCVSSGSMTFYKDDMQLANVSFNTDKDYRHIAFYNQERLTALALSEAGARVLEDFSQR